MRTRNKPPEGKVSVITNVTLKRNALAIEKQLNASEGRFRHQCRTHGNHRAQLRPDRAPRPTASA
ncbi:MAG TPA: hypothetical protein VFB92_24505 [Vicinamibacterales bacterium]|nr:hypothetical protein [Vicinamibacterales bacterium]